MTLPTSDSLSGTTSFIELRSLRIANAELEEPEPLEEELEELDEPAAAPRPADEPPAADSPEELLALEALVVPPPETVSPT